MAMAHLSAEAAQSNGNGHLNGALPSAKPDLGAPSHQTLGEYAWDVRDAVELCQDRIKRLLKIARALHRGHASDVESFDFIADEIEQALADLEAETVCTWPLSNCP